MGKRGVEGEAAVEGETNSIEQWENIVKKWHPVNRKLAEIIASIPPDKRVGATEQLSEMAAKDTTDYLQFVTNLTSLSGEAFKRITQALNNTK